VEELNNPRNSRLIISKTETSSPLRGKKTKCLPLTLNHLDPNRHVRGESQYLDDVPCNRAPAAAVFESPLAHGVHSPASISAR
jgi:hypothetical protein